ncbi:MAG: YlbF family regulator [Verrucomicrobia bacterium]|nr:MAG: YlbF family regulator [Verrucomicrobiota bacterium]TAE86720.1 MAG: YlbF family regulator [Verrucomicrobiota bacterium]TAF24524.1 MAG: YlbF family regulator [Verrucomicrobiota bacterium]
MTLLTETSAVIVKTRELCSAIANDEHFSKLQKDVERFLDDDAARKMYQTVHQRGEELHQKQHAGMKLAPAEISEFEAARDALMRNEVASAFLDAQGELESLQRTIGKYVTMTLELGRVPTEEEIAEAEQGGCCGGGGGEGCCSH